MDFTQRKKESQNNKIKDLANFIAGDFIYNSSIDLDRLVNEESIMLHYDHYEKSFDGLLIYDKSNFFIHLDIDSGNFKDSKRSRFSIAHELGHYFIPEHHQAIINGTFPLHPSRFNPCQRNEIEGQADIFASTLLMPGSIFKEACYRQKFSLKLIDELSERFKVSKLSTLLRFTDIDAGTYPVMIFFIQNGFLNWFKASDDFPFRNVPFKSKIGNPPPPTSAIGEFYLKNESKFKDVQLVYADDWFWVNSTMKLNEQCFYSEYGYDISVIWPD